MPMSRSTRAATKPSPPLLPGPHTTATCPRSPSSISIATCATARPAVSISVNAGMPMSSIVARSSARISAAVTTGLMALQPTRDSRYAGGMGARHPVLLGWWLAVLGAFGLGMLINSELLLITPFFAAMVVAVFTYRCMRAGVLARRWLYYVLVGTLLASAATTVVACG